jgi:glycine betaine/proline transport system ATP-binding protein
MEEKQMAPVVEIRNLTKIFGPREKEALDLFQKGKSNDEIFNLTAGVVAVRNISFHVDRGQICMIMGLSGSGKSTLLRCINRLVEPTLGEICMQIEKGGRFKITKLSNKKLFDVRRKHMAMVFQNFGLFPRKSVLENVCFGLSLQKKDNIQRRAIEALQLVKLEKWSDAYPSQLSGGMQQRVGLARALATDVEILLMDEAFSALDPLIRQNMQEELLALQADLKKTMLFVTHDLAEALRLGDNIIIMQDGQFVQEGSPEEIIINPKTEYVKNFVKNADPSEVIKAETISTKRDDLFRNHQNQLSMSEDGNHYGFQLTSNNKLKKVVLNNENQLTFAEFQNQTQTIAEPKKEKIWAVQPETPLRKLVEVMMYSRYLFVVLSKEGEFHGVVTRRNIFKALLKNFERR